jgi:hypothetical protein
VFLKNIPGERSFQQIFQKIQKIYKAVWFAQKTTQGFDQ